ncbi:MAG: UDP-3-O-(3-hydroxymyristoyl)glucosamine N-acyltransferase [Acidobacteria bacterium]|nr:UDP-3-O-(3-hydroxymyristoyl)glucosamine N-acyltransferase [Acidobacteriota bacterium]
MSTSHTARELADFLGAELFGDVSLIVSGVASPESAGPEDLIYCESSRHIQNAARSKSRCVLVAGENSIPSKTALRVSNPKLSFVRAAHWLLSSRPSKQPSLAPQIHATAVISPTARLGVNSVVGPFAVIENDVEIGQGTRIGAFAFLGEGARVGDECLLHPHVTLYAGAKLGTRVVVHSGVVIGSDGFGYVFDGENHLKFPQIGRVEISDEVEIGANTTIDRGALAITRIGKGTKIDNLVQIAHNVVIGRNTVIASQTGISGSCTIGDHVAMGGQVGLGDHCEIEDGAILGGQAGVLPGKKIRKGQFVWGTPARPMEKFREQHALLARLPQMIQRWKDSGPAKE